ncbi:calcineurin subunit B type 2-like [Physella acuta]|uniref:calcineurin subunit B type 2-like n=1 Tax=Physella acuta TaxID=109671 RepID=UPI0027DB9D06|nr:calcineurin subunit B type 2-like [Physella acuta]
MSILYALLVCLPALTLAQQFHLYPYDQTAATGFTHVDFNHDGVFDRNELDHIFRDIDTNRDGSVSFHEYTESVNVHGHDPHTTHVLHAMFDAYDVNNDGVVNHHDYDLFFSLADGNADNLLERNEFIHYVATIFEIADNA